MARRIEHRASAPWNAERVHATLVDPAFLRDRLGALGGTGATLVDHQVSNGEASFRMRHGIPAEDVPPVARPLLGGGLVIERVETWRTEAAGRYSGTVRADTSGLPGELAGVTLLVDLPEGGSELSITGQVKVSIPLVGGKVETVVADQVRRLLAKEVDFALDWIAKRAS